MTSSCVVKQLVLVYIIDITVYTIWTIIFSNTVPVMFKWNMICVFVLLSIILISWYYISYLFLTLWEYMILHLVQYLHQLTSDNKTCHMIKCQMTIMWYITYYIRVMWSMLLFIISNIHKTLLLLITIN